MEEEEEEEEEDEEWIREFNELPSIATEMEEELFKDEIPQFTSTTIKMDEEDCRNSSGYDPVKCLEWQGKQKNLTAPVKEAIETLKFMIKYLQLHLKWGKIVKVKFNKIDSAVRIAGRSCHEACNAIKHGRMNDALSSLSSVLSPIEGGDLDWEVGDATRYIRSISDKASMTAEEVLEYYAMLPKMVKYLVPRIRYGNFSSFAKMLDPTVDKLTFLGRFLNFTSKWCIEHENLIILGSKMSGLVETARFLFDWSLTTRYQYWDHNMYASPFLTEVTDIEKEINEVYIQVLKASWTSRITVTSMSTEHITTFVDSLLDIIKVMLDEQAVLVIPLEEEIATICQGLRFLIGLITDFRKQGVKDMNLIDLLMYIEVEFISMITKSSVPMRMSSLLFELEVVINLMKAEIFLTRVLEHSKVPEKDVVRFIHRELKSTISAALDLLEQGDAPPESTEVVTKDLGSPFESLTIREVTEDEYYDMHPFTSELLLKIKLMKEEIRLVELLNNKIGLVVLLRDQIQTLHDELMFLVTLLLDLPEKYADPDHRYNILSWIDDFASEAGTFICSLHINKMNEEMKKEMNLHLSSFLQKTKMIKEYDRLNCPKIVEMLGSDGIPATDGIGFIKYLTEYLAEVLNLNANELTPLIRHQIKTIQRELASFRLEDIAKLQNAGEITGALLLMDGNSQTANRRIVKLDDVADALKKKAIGEGNLRLDVIFILSMPGLGKTVLAERVYKDLSESDHFTVHAWCHVSEIYDKKEVLINILRQIIEHPGDIDKTDEGDLVNLLHQYLDKKKYLIVLDDIGSTEAFDDLKVWFQDKNNGSRVIITTQNADMVSGAEYLEFNSLLACITRVAYEVECVVDSYISTGREMIWYHLLSDVIDLIMRVEKTVAEISDSKEIIASTNVSHGHSSKPQNGSENPATPAVSEANQKLVSFEEVVDKLTDKSVEGKQGLDIISIIGMPGLGKTTLAKRIYNDLKEKRHFDIYVWCHVSQWYDKKALLIEILRQIIKLPGDIDEKDAGDLVKLLHESLDRQRYLIVMDDIWSETAFEELSTPFEDNNNGSRVIITTRFDKVAPLDSHREYLRLLNVDESWTLLCEIVFQKRECPSKLEGIGRQIAKKCQGLPLSVVLVAGLLKGTGEEPDKWEHIAEKLSSLIAREDNKWRGALELSYIHLPEYLKPCFLYFGLILDEKKISVSKLIRLWIAEGFVKKVDPESQEHVAERTMEKTAEKYLMRLIDRSLVMQSESSYDGRIKSCIVHDLVRESCCAKAEDEKFLLWINRDLETDSAPSNFPQNLNQRRLSLYREQDEIANWRPEFSPIRSLFLKPARKDKGRLDSFNVSVILGVFRLLKVLDLEFINVGELFPEEVRMLIHLRYLAVRFGGRSIPSSIAKLKNLETLFIKGLKEEVSVPNVIWGMVKLRHVNIDACNFVGSSEFLECNYLETLSTPSLSYGDAMVEIMKRMINLRKLKCKFLESWGYSEQGKLCNRFPLMDALGELESLKVSYGSHLFKQPCQFNFPLKLKKLTMSKFRSRWEEISVIGSLPELVVLKLENNAFNGELWEVRNDEFPKLEVLKLDNLNLEKLEVENMAFPILKRLVFRSCKSLERIPSYFEDHLNLESIEVRWCSTFVADSAEEVQEVVARDGNRHVKVSILPAKSSTSLRTMGAESFISTQNVGVREHRIESFEDAQHIQSYHVLDSPVNQC